MMLFLICWALVIAFFAGLHWLDRWTRRTASKRYDYESDRW